jgi:hypothetical protein
MAFSALSYRFGRLIVENEIMVQVNMLQGERGCTTAAMALIRQWALGENITAITIQGIAASNGGRGAMILALQAIKALGDSYDVLTQQDNPITAIYWLIDGTD